MKNKILIFIVVVLTFFACNHVETVYNFEVEETIAIPLENLRAATPPFDLFDYCLIDNIETLIFYETSGKLVFYDMSTNSVYHNITLLKDRRLDAFEYINKDSILLLYSYTNDGIEIEFNDFSLLDTLKLQLVDFDGNVKKYYHFNCDEDNCTGINYKIEQILPPYTSLFYKTIKRMNNIVFFFPFSYGYYNFDTIKNNSPLIAYYDLHTEKFIVSKNVKLPYLKDKMYYPSNHDVLNFCISANGLPLLRFFYSSDVFEWDYKNDKLIKYNLKSKLIDTIPPFSYPINDMNATNARYSTIYYDNNNELYYSYLYLSSDIFGENYWSVIIADKNLNYINEVVNIKNLYNPAFFNKNIISYDPMQYNTIILKKSKLITERKDYNGYIKSIRQDIETKIKKRDF